MKLQWFTETQNLSHWPKPLAFEPRWTSLTSSTTRPWSKEHEKTLWYRENFIIFHDLNESHDEKRQNSHQFQENLTTKLAKVRQKDISSHDPPHLRDPRDIHVRPLCSLAGDIPRDSWSEPRQLILTVSSGLIHNERNEPWRCHNYFSIMTYSLHAYNKIIHIHTYNCIYIYIAYIYVTYICICIYIYCIADCSPSARLAMMDAHIKRRKKVSSPTTINKRNSPGKGWARFTWGLNSLYWGWSSNL